MFALLVLLDLGVVAASLILPLGDCPAPCDSLTLLTPLNDLDLSVPPAFYYDLDTWSTGILREATAKQKAFDCLGQ